MKLCQLESCNIYGNFVTRKQPTPRRQRLPRPVTQGCHRLQGALNSPDMNSSDAAPPTEISPGLPAGDPQNWPLGPEVIFLNHGAFGGCPRRVLEVQHDWRLRLERQPVQFLGRELEPRLDCARAALAHFLGALTEDLVFVPNTTTGVNT